MRGFVRPRWCRVRGRSSSTRRRCRACRRRRGDRSTAGAEAGRGRRLRLRNRRGSSRGWSVLRVQVPVLQRGPEPVPVRVRESVIDRCGCGLDDGCRLGHRFRLNCGICRFHGDGCVFSLGLGIGLRGVLRLDRRLCLDRCGGHGGDAGVGVLGVIDDRKRDGGCGVSGSGADSVAS